MRILLALAFSVAAISHVFAQEAPKTRPATEAEIRQALPKTKELKEGKNGYAYRQGSNVGYKISKGSICTLQGSKKDCVSVRTDGKRLTMIDERGNRELLN